MSGRSDPQGPAGARPVEVLGLALVDGFAGC